MGVLNIITGTPDPHTPIMLAEALKVSKPMITAHLTSLMNQGYITRQPSPEDKRAYYILPTKKALDLVKDAAKLFFLNLIALYLSFCYNHITKPLLRESKVQDGRVKIHAMGYFIGSGAVESSNKIIVQRRLKQAGMRWGVSTAQYLVTLVAKWESGLWEPDVVSRTYKILE